MRFLANENFPKPSISYLREQGHFVNSIQEELAGIPDEEVVEIAANGNLIILTFDSDYGEILFKHPKENPPSVVYFRFKGNAPKKAGEILVDLLSYGIQIQGFFTVIEETGIRQRKI